MAGEWQELSIDDVADVVGGGTPSTGDESNFNGDIPWITPKDLSGYSNRYIARGERNISEKGLQNSSARLLPMGAVLLTTRAPVGYVAIAANPVSTNQGFRSLIPHNGFHPEFFYYLLKINTDYLKAHASGTTFGELSGSTLKVLKFPIPPLPEQRVIAYIVGTLDDKIELNRKMSQTLEDIAKTIFRSWFVDFDPVRAKVEGRNTGLTQPITGLFPDSFEDSELGQVPFGWNVMPLGELTNLTKGVSYSSSELTESDTALVTLKSFARGGGYRPEGLKSFSGSYKANQVVTPGEVVVACTDVTQAAEVVGRPAMVRPSSNYKTLVASLDTLIIRPKDERLTRAFLYCLCGLNIFTAHTYAHTTGTTVLHLASNAVPSFRLALPSPNLVQAFNNITVSLLAKIQNIEQESETLSNLRDSLLPKLVSGELRVKDVGRIIKRID